MTVETSFRIPRLTFVAMFSINIAVIAGGGSFCEVLIPTDVQYCVLAGMSSDILLVLHCPHMHLFTVVGFIQVDSRQSQFIFNLACLLRYFFTRPECP